MKWRRETIEGTAIVEGIELAHTELMGTEARELL
jgi:hypothetical protein